MLNIDSKYLQGEAEAGSGAARLAPMQANIRTNVLVCQRVCIDFGFQYPLNLLPGFGNPLGPNTGGTGIGPNQNPNQGSNTSVGNIIGDFLNPIGALSHLL
jgi:hypothetical protein